MDISKIQTFYDIDMKEYENPEMYHLRCKEIFGKKSGGKRPMNPITTRLNVDNLLLQALREDISDEDVTTIR